MTGTSSFLPDSVRGIAGTAWIASGTWRGDSSARRARAIGARSASSSATPSREHDEQQQLAGAAGPVLEVDDERVRDPGQRLDDRVELRGPQPDAAAVERGVGAAGDHARAAVGDRRASRRGATRPGSARSTRPASAARPRRARTPTGIEGIGAVMTSSPCRPRTARPSSSNASTRAPSIRQLISPAHTGTSGDGPRNPVHRSVPPLSEPTGIPGFTASRTQWKPAAGSGAPVDPTPRSGPRSSAGSSPGVSPAARQAMRNGAARPRYVTRSSEASCHSVREVRPRRVAVEQDEGRADRQPGHEVVPHHPAGRREPAEAVRRGRGRCGAPAP